MADPRDNATDAWKTTHHRTSIRTGFLILLYMVIVGLLGSLAYAVASNPAATTEARVATAVICGVMALGFLIIVSATVADRRGDVNQAEADEPNIIERTEKF